MKTEETLTIEINKLSKQQLIKIINYLEEIKSEWYHPNEEIHRNTNYLFKELYLLFKELKSTNEKTQTTAKNLINKLIPISEIQEFIEVLHNVMFCYIENSNKVGYIDLSACFLQYKIIRDLLIKLSLLDKELSPFKHCTTELEVLPRRLVVSTFLKARKMNFEQFKEWWFEPL